MPCRYSLRISSSTIDSDFSFAVLQEILATFKLTHHIETFFTFIHTKFHRHFSAIQKFKAIHSAIRSQ